jgi:type I restriction enzyme S subunit
MYKGLGKLGTQLNLNTDTIGDIKIPIPDAKEQTKIVTYLNQETDKNDNLIESIKNSIKYLQEYRSTLISATVTGKIDVRHEAAV